MEKMTLHIKNMVCDRCEMVIETALTALGLKVDHVQLGKAEVTRQGDHPTLKEIEKEMERFNFGLIKDEDSILVEKVKTTLIQWVDSGELETDDTSLSDYLAKKLAKSYATISRIFSRKEEITIEKYFIRLKIEKAKERVEYENLSFSEIAYQLGYKNLQHLSRQFKEITGMSMSEYQKLQNPERKSLDKI
ncbi:AraC family transcriptional regulator [Gracilimonas sediminicola]|uniref:Helix-turn-helix domain-containing protein n=1 Tax=Gracilimonas sediminicola TaxID=2952158 RepID=A0A9X2L354_9BACT|nr:helix-turn-helix domain-containing protein [Gracilimonas sediminicola]MCP9291412.1 helix-turn-helix domain-containing protein [Gracilimonas sediminicola]